MRSMLFVNFDIRYDRIMAADINITYKVEECLEPNEFIGVLIDSSLGERRPVNDIDRITRMLNNANLIVGARDSGKLVGIARAITDFSYCTYLSDLAVRKAYQKLGIGKQLIRNIKDAAPQATLILLSAPAAVAYYPKIGLSRHEAAFTLENLDELL